MGGVKSANRLANKPYRQSASFLQNANRFSKKKKRQFLDFQTENRTKLTLSLAPSTRFERVAFRLGVRRTMFWVFYAFSAKTRQSLLLQWFAWFCLLIG